MEATPTTVPAATTPAVTCRHCQRANPPARRFCGGCGQSLWERCPQCQAECAADERFCGSCGSDIHAQLGARCDQHQQALDEALALAAAHQYDSALLALATVAEITDPRFETLALRAKGEIARLLQVQKEQTAAAAKALTDGKELFAAYAYEQTQAVLEQVPAPLRSDELVHLLGRARACRSEVLALSGEIRQAVEGKRFGELLPKLDRLLGLKPNHAQAKQLAEQLRDKLVKSASERLAQHKYQEALDQLGRIPEVVLTGEIVALRDKAAELHSLFQELHSAALADRNLLQLGERMSTLAPGDPAVAKLTARIKQKVQSPPEQPRLGSANWAPIPQRTLLGLPVDWLAHPTRVPAANDAVAQTLREHSGQFFVALGLALQGLDLAACDMDLLPRSGGGLLSKLPSLSLGRRPPAAAWGLDVSDTALKAVKLVREGKEQTLKIEAAEFILHQRPLHHPAAESSRGVIVAETLAAFLSRAGELKNVKVFTSVAGCRVLGRFCELPPMAAKKVADSAQYEAKHQLPIALDDLCWGYALQDEVAGKAADEQPRRVVIQAIRESYVRERLVSFKTAGIAVDSVQSECLSLHNVLLHEFEMTGQENDEAVAAVDIGVDSTNIVVSSPRCVWFRTFGHGGDHYTRELTKALQITAEQAEAIKRDPARAAKFSLLCQAWQPLFVQLASEIERSLATYRKLFPDRPIRHLYGLGGSFPNQGLLRYLRTGK